MRVIVTGGGGFAGSYLVKHLLKNGHDVTSISNGPAPDDQKDIYTQIDLLDLTALSEIDFKNIDAVFHLAGMTNVGESFSKPALYIKVNAEIQINLFETCIAQEAHPRFVIVSSGLIYDPKCKSPLNENSPVVANSPYSVSKIDQEALAQYYSTRNFEVVIARAFNHVGPGQLPGFLVADLAKRIAEAEKTNQNTIKVGNLSAKRDYSDVRDIVAAYELLATKGRPGEIYNVCSGNPRSGEEVLNILLENSESQITTKPDPNLMRPSDTPEIYGDPTKLKNDTDWEPKISLEQTLKETLEYWRSKE